MVASALPESLLTVLLTSVLGYVLPGMQSSNAKLDMWFARKGSPKTIVATGFIAKNPTGQVRRLERISSIWPDLAVAPCVTSLMKGLQPFITRLNVDCWWVLMQNAHTWLLH